MQKLNSLIEKYNRPGPRYTSYPPVPFWQQAPSEVEWIGHIKANYNPQTGVDLYVHIPFCEKLCYYCGCNRTITRNHEVEDPYIQIVFKEWDLYCEKLGFIPKINSLHFGGGTPTFLNAANLRTLILYLTKMRSDSFLGSIEIDPRTCSDEHLMALKETGITRVSLGIQDFDPIVQAAINRHQPVSMVENLVKRLRELEFKSINFDLIYGLPRQTKASIASTMEIVAQLRPDLIAFYGYAHLPERIKNQRLIKEVDLPSAKMRRELYESGKKTLAGYGYDDIGMDHFALPGSYLHEAKIQKTLHRNFMGYVEKKSSVLIGLGPTSISDSSISFVQNSKELKAYEEKIKSGVLALENGHSHRQEDLIIQEIILRLMCDGEVPLNKKLIPQWDEVREELLAYQKDGLVIFDDEKLSLSDLGKIFMRNIAMVFDYHLRQKTSNAKFSQTI